MESRNHDIMYASVYLYLYVYLSIYTSIYLYLCICIHIHLHDDTNASTPRCSCHTFPISASLELPDDSSVEMLGVRYKSIDLRAGKIPRRGIYNRAVLNAYISYRVTSLKKTHLPVGPFRRDMQRALWWF